MTARLRRKEIKRNEFLAAVETAAIFVEANWRRLVGAVLAIVVVAVLIGLFVSSRKRSELAAGSLLGRALTASQAPVDVEGADPGDEASPSFPDAASRDARAAELFAEVEREYPSSKAAGVARLAEASRAAANGDLERARELWTDYLARHRGGPLAVGVQLNLLRLSRLEGRGDEAVEELRALLDQPSSGLPADALLFELGTTLDELGREVEAETTWQRLLDEHPASPYSQDAGDRRGATS